MVFVLDILPISSTLCCQKVDCLCFCLISFYYLLISKFLKEVRKKVLMIQSVGQSAIRVIMPAYRTIPASKLQENESGGEGKLERKRERVREGGGMEREERKGRPVETLTMASGGPQSLLGIHSASKEDIREREREKNVRRGRWQESHQWVSKVSKR